MTDSVALIAFAGGLDEVTPDATVSPGVVRRSINYEVVAEGGYRRIGGYRRWSGRDVTPESDAIAVLEVPTLDFAPGDTAQQTHSGTAFRPVATIARPSTSLLVVEKSRATARIEAGDTFADILIGAVIDASPALTDAERASVFSAVESFERGRAQPLAGDGDIVLVQSCDRAMFALRMDGADARVQRNTPPKDSFTAGGGWLDSGVIRDVPDGARWEAYSYRFAGSEPAVFAVNGVGPAHRIRRRAGNQVADPEPIDDSVPDADGHPTHVIVHREHLFLGYATGAVLFSDLGDPMSFTALGGGAEFSMSDAVTGFEILPGGALGIYCEDRIGILSGTSAADFALDIYSDSAGAIAGTLQGMPSSVFCDRRAITTLAASDAYGNFRSAALSQLFDQTYQRIRRGGRLFSLVNREKSQYRIINEDGRGLYLTFLGDQLAGALEVDLGRRITAVGTLDGDEDRAFIAGGDGYLYQLDAGTTFDGSAFESFVEIADHAYRSPRDRKRFKEIDVEIEGDPRLRLTVTNILDAGTDAQADTAPVETVDEARSVPRYRDDLLSRFTQRFAGIAYLVGTGRSMALRFVPTSGHAHTIKSVAVHFTRRGQTR